MKTWFAGLLLLLVVLPGAVFSRPPPVDHSLSKTDIVEVTEAADGQSMTLRLSPAAVEALQKFAEANPGKRVRLLFKEATLADSFDPDWLESDQLVVDSPSEEVRKAMECWKKGCPSDSYLDDDSDCD